MIVVQDKKSISPLFEGWEETMITSCLQECMGTAWADREESPKSACIRIGDFAFWAGKPDLDLLKQCLERENPKFVIVVFRTPDWEPYLEKICGKRARRVMRYATKKERDCFCRKQLEQRIQNLPKEWELKQIDQELFEQIQRSDWARDLCSQYKDYADYQKNGLGYVVLVQGEMVSGASSYTYYPEGIEIEIDTRQEFRRQGLATVCGAKLILECLKQGRYPSWDAQNVHSLKLAEKLGYRFAKEYAAYEVSREERQG